MKSKEKIIVVGNFHRHHHHFSIGTEVKILDFDNSDRVCYCEALDGERKGLPQFVNVKDLTRVKMGEQQ